MIIDAHTHLNFPVFDNDRDGVFARMFAADVSAITVGTNKETSESAIALAKAYPGKIWATIGFHPGHVIEAHAWHHDKNEQKSPIPEVFNENIFRALAREKEVVAIGECGLDYFRNPSEGTKKKQAEVFLEQVAIAKEVKKPLMIHCRPSKGSQDAYFDLLALLPKDFASCGVVHFFVGDKDVAREFLDRSFAFTFGGVLTLTSDFDDVVRFLPDEAILIETDAPYVSPKAFRGKRNEPSFILETIKTIAALRGKIEEDIISLTTTNAQRIFSLK